MSQDLPDKVREQMKNAGLPSAGQVPFVPQLTKNRRGATIIEKAVVRKGPKKDKRGYLDISGRIWIRDSAHANVPDHWDVQLDGGEDYFRVDCEGNRLP